MTTKKHNKPLLVLRSSIFWLWSIFSTLLMGLPVLGSRLISYELSAKFSVMWLRLNLWGLDHICGLTCKVQGMENIPDKPVVVMAKHQSTWETYFIPTLLKRAVYVAKRSLQWIPIFGWSLVALKFILIDRTSGRSAISQMVEQAQDRFANGISVIVFPEGTRVPVGAPPRYRIGGAIIAAQTGVDVVPIALNAGEFWPRHGYIKWPGEITVIVGPVISSKGKSAEQILQEVEAWIEGQMQVITVLDRFT